MTTLYLIPTPNDNPDDITLRALRLLGEVSAVATPDPAATAALLTFHGVEARRLIAPADLLGALEQGDAVLVGIGDVPAVADDQGEQIVREAIRSGIRIEPIPGVSLPITALVLSALPPDNFVSIGRLPDNFASSLNAYADEQSTLVMTLHAEQLTDVLVVLREGYGDRPFCLVSRPGTRDGVTLRGTLTSLRMNDLPTSGDLALVIGGAPEVPVRVWDEAEVRAALEKRLDAGEPLKLAAKAVAADAGWDRRSVYRLGFMDGDHDRE